MNIIRCDCCGKFRKHEDVIGCANEYEEWIECIDCCCGIDRERILETQNLIDREG